jgi:hypothetical protein
MPEPDLAILQVTAAEGTAKAPYHSAMHACCIRHLLSHSGYGSLCVEPIACSEAAPKAAPAFQLRRTAVCY